MPRAATGTNGGAREQIWIFDVDGVSILINGESFRTTPAGDQQEIEQIVESITFP